MEDNKLEPAEIVRSEMGTWTHPVYSKYMNEHLDLVDPTNQVCFD